MTGTIILWVAFVASLIGAILYQRAATGKARLVREARWSLMTSVVAILAAAVLLFFYIMQHRFDVNYVYGYSSRDLPTYLLVTTFWAGQEGSFLLWATFGALFGLLLRSYARSRRIEYEVMAVYGFLQTVMLLLVVIKTPFTPVWEAFPNDLQVGQVPPDGRGLNPLLQNMWMAIHPPILFIGFAALAVPFALAVTALWRRTYHEWASVALPWVLFSVVALGSGLMLGGYWAYGVLGWGGWWGWDPVENASLIPWLVAVGLLHTLLVQKKNGGFARTNFLLAVLAYVLVVHSTFLTRSGILGDASVHSFTDPGTFIYTLLLLWVLSLAFIGLGLLARRWKDLTPTSVVTGIWRKDSMLGWTSVVIGLLAFIVFIGTNWPIVSNASVEPSFYNKTGVPIGILLAVLLGVSLALQWEEVPFAVAFKRMLVSLAGAAAVTAVIFFMGVTDVLPLLFSLTSLFALFMSIRAAFVMYRVEALATGGPLAHTGLAIVFLGVIGSGFYSEQKTVSLPQGQTVEVMGYQLTYAGNAPTPDGKFIFTVNAKHGESAFSAMPVMFRSDYNNSVMRNPDYVSFLTRDFYVEPVSLEPGQRGGQGQMVQVPKGGTVEIAGYVVTFERFEMQPHAAGMAQQAESGMRIGAVLKVKKDRQIRTVTPVSVFAQGEVQSSKGEPLDGQTELRLVGMNIGMSGEGSTIVLEAAVPGASATATPEALVVEASVKPFISLVWIGALICFFGVMLALVRRRREGLEAEVEVASQHRPEPASA
ncbi:MAG: cytochrome c biogenesis protein CcsA [Bacteroidetes bacterium]|jgi:cytochrome c-type biogenesis protein CcmF|nr:cytochrome c biogenesis protein CcsA [Bacteroidota bacterium]